MTKQLVQGRSRRRRLQFGEMEKDYHVAHGAALMLLKKLKNTFNLYRSGYVMSVVAYAIVTHL